MSEQHRRRHHPSDGAFSCSDPGDRICKGGYYCADRPDLTCALDPSSVSLDAMWFLCKGKSPAMAAQNPCPPKTTEASGGSWGTAMGRDIKDPAIHLVKGTLKDFIFKGLLILITDIYFW